MMIKTRESVVALTVITAFSGVSLWSGELQQDVMNDGAMMTEVGT